jgi:hypothetical protein
VVDIWLLETTNLCWYKIPTAVTVPRTAQNMAVRVASAVNEIFLHGDIDRITATLFKIEQTLLIELPQGKDKENVVCEKDEPLKEFADVFCPICLDTYTDPRTLSCGHSVCFSCLCRMREIGTSSGTVKCPTCRKVTKIPSEGLPTNYSLQDAIHLMVKAQVARSSGLRCEQCRLPQTETDMWACVNCAKPNVDEVHSPITDRALTLCAKCTLKSHEGHLVKPLEELRVYGKNVEDVKEKTRHRHEELITAFWEDMKNVIEETLLNSPNGHRQKLERTLDASCILADDEIFEKAEETVSRLEQTIQNVRKEMETAIQNAF